MAIFFSVLGDHYRLRSPVVWFAGLLGILGYIILFTQLHNNPVRLGAIFCESGQLVAFSQVIHDDRIH